MKTLPLRVCSLGLSLFLLTACSRRETPAVAGLRTQTLLLGNGAEPVDLDPHMVAANSDANILYALFEGLTGTDEKTAAAVPAAAERWDVSADGRTYTFRLRPNLRWSNGDPLTANDFVFAFRRMLHPKFGGEMSYMLWPIKAAEALNLGTLADFSALGAKALDDRTLQIALERPTPYVPALASHWTWFPLHQPTLEKYSAVAKRGTNWTRAGNLVGNGPFTLQEWTPNARIVVRKNARYWDDAHTRLNEIVFFPIENPDVEERAFRAGQLHVTWDVPTAKIRTLRTDHASPLAFAPVLSTSYLYFNLVKPPMGDVRVRRALALAIDRAAISRAVTHGTRPPAKSVTPPNCGGYTARAAVHFDFERARRLLAEAGYPGGKGLPEIPVQTLNSGNFPAIVEAIQAMWQRELGVRISVEPLEFKTVIQNLQTKTYTVQFLHWIADFADPVSFLEIFATSNRNNPTSWSNANYDRWLSEAANTANIQARFELLQQAEAVLLEEAPVTPVDHVHRVYLLHPTVKNWKPSVLGQYRYGLVALDGDGTK